MSHTRTHLSIAPDPSPIDRSIPRECDSMGFGHESWVCLPRSQYPKRSDAIKWWCNWTGCDWIEASVLARWAVYDHDYAAEIGEDWWRECPRDTPGAFRVWRCE